MKKERRTIRHSFRYINFLTDFTDSPYIRFSLKMCLVYVLPIYSQERTICDLFRSRRNIEIQDLQNAVREYVRLKKKNIPLLMRYSKLFSVEKIVRQYLEALL
jgi:hypothetical protein